jgi:hypothetical protein
MNIFCQELSKEVEFLDVVISTFRLQFKDVINVITAWMMFERNNKINIMNVGRVQVTKLVLDLFQLFTFDKLHFTIITIIKHLPS